MTSVMAAAMVSFLYENQVAVLIIASMLSVLGGLLNWAFRSEPGPMAVFWQRCRQSRDPRLYRFYAKAGPWAWRLGLGGLVGLAVAVVALQG